MEWSKEQQRALERMRSGANIFLHGEAGTGKSAVLNHFISENKERVISLASTGLAACGMKYGGITVHRFLNRSNDSDQREAIMRKYKIIIVEEISMVRSDIFSQLERSLRSIGIGSLPFGGFQIIVSGDFFQLPPVVTSQDEYDFLSMVHGSEWPFDTAAWKQAKFESVVLRIPFRQQNTEWLMILNAIRYRGSDLGEQLGKLNNRVERQQTASIPRLCCYRNLANTINQRVFKKWLLGPIKTLVGRRCGFFPDRDLPVVQELQLKYEAFVMIIANDPAGQYVNGDLGFVTGWEENGGVYVKLARGPEVLVLPYKWRNEEYYFDKEQRILTSKVIGEFYQIPINLAYATTIHKAQGQTLERGHIVLPNRPCFAPGQVYVALSRIRDLAGVTLNRPLTVEDILVDERVQRFSQTLK